MLPHCEEGACPCQGCYAPGFPRYAVVANTGLNESIDTVGGLLALETENAQLKREVERLTAALESQRSMLADSVDSAFCLQPVMTHEELCVTLEREAGEWHRDTANTIIRLRESEAKAWGLLCVLHDELASSHNIETARPDETDRAMANAREALEERQAALAARKAGA
jgi:hypothetical protein